MSRYHYKRSVFLALGVSVALNAVAQSASVGTTTGVTTQVIYPREQPVAPLAETVVPPQADAIASEVDDQAADCTEEDQCREEVPLTAMSDGKVIDQGWLSAPKPANSERLLPDATFHLWVSANLGEAINKANQDAANAEELMRFVEQRPDKQVVRSEKDSGRVHFESGLAEIDKVFAEQLFQVIDQLDKTRITRLKFIGHADPGKLKGDMRRKYGDNQGLSRARAERIARYFTERLDVSPHVVFVEGRAARDPIATNKTKEGRSLNRRVDVEVWYDELAQPTSDVRTASGAIVLPRDTGSDHIQICRERQVCYQREVDSAGRGLIKVRNELPAIQFVSGRADITPEAVADIRQVFDKYRGKKDLRLRVIGHTDNEKLSEFAKKIYKDNVGLSMSRAQQVAEYIRNELALAPEDVAVDGRGEWEPVADNKSARGRARNRRVELELWFRENDNLDLAGLQRCDVNGEVQPGFEKILRTEAVEPQDPFTLSDFRISVDGLSETDGNGLGHSADVQRCTDVAMAAADLQMQYDASRAEKRLNVSAWVPDASPSVVKFRGYSNYSAFFSWGEIRVFGPKQSLRRKPLATISLSRDLDSEWQVPERLVQRYGNSMRYLLRVYNGKGKWDETAPQPLWVSAQSTEAQAKQDQLAAFGESRLVKSSIPVDGGTVTVSGDNVPQGHQAWVMDERIPVAPNGSFVTERLVPRGLNRIEIALTDSRGSGDVYLRDISIDDSHWFFIAMADLSVGTDRSDGGLRETDNSSNAFQDESVADGRVAFYLDGKTKSGINVTASLDTGEKRLEDIADNFDDKNADSVFRRLDQDRFYPTLGDDSTVVPRTPKQGKLYVRVEKDGNAGMVGNQNITLRDNELAPIDRSVYAASAKGSVGPEAFKTSATVYAAEPDTVLARERHRGTGGSLYYLRNRDVVVGSEQVRVEVRDKDSDIVLSERTLTFAQDYDFDALQGRITLHSPLASYQRDEHAVRSGTLDGNPQYLTIRYEYSAQTPSDNKLVGARVTQNITEKLTVGVTAARDDLGRQDHELHALDVQWTADNGSYIRFEVGESNGVGTPTHLSNNGGFSFGKTEDIAIKRPFANYPKAHRLESSIKLGDDAQVDLYLQEREAGYSAVGVDADARVSQYGVGIDAKLGDNADLRIDYDYREEDQAHSTEALNADVTVRLDRHWRVTTGLRQDDLGGEGVASTVRAERGEATTLAVELGYNSLRDWESWLFLQDTLERDSGRRENDRYGVGGAVQLFEKLRLKAEIAEGEYGAEGELRADYKWSDKDSLYLSYALAPDRTDTGLGARKGNLTTGFRSRFADKASVYAEQHRLSGNQITGLTHVFGVDFQLGNHWAHGVSIESGELYDFELDQSIDRQAISLSTNYTGSKFGYGGLLEYREDDYTDLVNDSRRVTLSRHTFSYQLDASQRLLAKLNLYRDYSRLNDDFDIEYTEGVLGYGLRPVDNDRWNLLFKYTWFEDLPPAQQRVAGRANNLMQRSQVLSLDTQVELGARWDVYGKYAWRSAEVSANRLDPDWVRADAQLVVIGGEFHIVRRWDLILEARMLDEIDAEQTRSGVLLALYRHFGQNLKLGVGYNFTEFSDDLTELDADSEGLFLNILGKM